MSQFHGFTRLSLYVWYSRPHYKHMIVDKILRTGIRAMFDDFRILFPLSALLLHAVGLFLPGFGCGRCERELYLALQHRDLRFQRLQLVLRLPYAADRFLQNRNIPLVGYVLRLVLLHELGMRSSAFRKFIDAALVSPINIVSFALIVRLRRSDCSPSG